MNKKDKHQKKDTKKVDKGNKNKANLDKLDKEKDKNKGEDNKMATQIAATPIIYGEEARNVMKEAKTVQSEKSKSNAKKLIDFFSKYVQKED